MKVDIGGCCGVLYVGLRMDFSYEIGLEDICCFGIKVYNWGGFG